VPSSPVEAVRVGLRAAERGSWRDVRAIMDGTDDAAVRQIMLWRLTTGGAGTFTEMRRALDELTWFPGRRQLRIAAEQRIAATGLSATEIITFLTRTEAGVTHQGPISAEGRIALAGASLALGRTADATRWAREVWRGHRLDTALQSEVLTRFGALLSADDHDARVEFLLWADRRTQARPLFALMTPEGRRNAEFRLGIAAGEGAVLTGSAVDDRGITFERVRQLRQQGREAEAYPLLASIDARGLPETAGEAMWSERRLLLIDAIRARDWQNAYAIASNHANTSGERFADGEFLAGWIALRFLNRPTVAATHFQTLDEGVSSAISKSRAKYWRGRAAEALGQQERALAFYREAAGYPTFYYGQLGAVRLAQLTGTEPRLTLPPERRALPQDRAALEALPGMRTLRLLVDSGNMGLFGQFAFALDDVLTTEGQHQALSEYARSLGLPQVAVRVAKAGLNRGVLATEAAFPFLTVPRLVGYGQIEDAYTMAIARQESEFNTGAVSPAGARGLMQFLPATAMSQARRMGIDHRTEWLTGRPDHALVLGAAHLADLRDRFYGSYPMVAIAYNAGPGRPETWVGYYGDPRGADLETAIDWVEKIPFGETRNYVMRVLENVQVYRARLAGGSAPLRLGQDLTSGTAPPPGFLIRVAPGAESAAPAPASANSPAP
jgi:soluble lytic murein transglycosylase